MAEFTISLAAARVNAGLTQAEVAKALHVAKQTIVSWEKGNTTPSASKYLEMCNLYKIDGKYIFLPCKSN